MMLKRFLGSLAVATLLVLNGAPALSAQTQPPQSAPEGFVPVDQLGEVGEELPATPLVAAAYGIAWAAVLVFVWSVWRRLNQVHRELAEVSRRIGPGARQ